MLLAKLKEEYQENFNGELEAKLMKIIGCCVPRVPVPEWLARLPWNFYTEFQERLLYKRVSTFFVIIGSSLFLKEEVWSKTTHFYEKYIKINCFKTNET